MIERLRERLSLVFLALLPLHAFLVTAGTKLLQGPGHAPWAMLALWKEALLLVIILLACIEIARKRSLLKTDVIDAIILSLFILSAFLALWLHTSRTLLFLGARYDLVPLCTFLILRRVPWSEKFRTMCRNLMLSLGALVALLGIVSLFLPTSVFVWLGYSDVHSLYQPNQPLAPYQQIGETWLRRIQSTMSGPNQLGTWLLLPLGFLFAYRGRKSRDRALLVLFFLGLLLTFSRSAWIASVLMFLVVLVHVLPKRVFRRFLLIGSAAAFLIAAVVTIAFPSVFFRLSSTRGHFVRPFQAAVRMLKQPIGSGLGSAGPATNRVSETCVFLRPQDNPDWAKSQPSLCVFLGTTQVQPKDHACHCPFLTENWYLQIGVELGVLGFVLFLSLIILVLRRLKAAGRTEEFSQAVFLGILGISIAALFLHAWEDAAVAYSGWLLMAVALAKHEAKKN